MIIHICGPSGSGKTTLGNKLKKKYGNKIVVKDLDDLRDEFIKKTYNTSKSWSFSEVKYQKYIDNYIKKNKKPLILVGLNDNNWGNTKTLYYKLQSDYNFYIKIDDDIIIEQKCERFINEELPNIVKQERKDITENNEFFIKQIIKVFKNECSAKKTKKLNKKWAKDYKKMGYKFMSREYIFKKVCNILK